MIIAGFLLLAVGAADLIRQFVRPRLRWIGYVAVVALLVLLSVVGDAPQPLLVAVAAGALWMRTMPDAPAPPEGTSPGRGPSRASFWPAAVLALLCALAVVAIGGREHAGIIGDAWPLRSPFGPISFDLVILVLGVFVFLLESGNVVVRAALAGEHTWKPTGDPPADAEPDAAPEGGADPAPGRGGFKGGRLIGPLERVIVFMLTLVPAYPLLAAMLAAKGIVRFPEISRDGETGARAEYFLVGSLVSWVVALGGAFLVWWAAHV